MLDEESGLCCLVQDMETGRVDVVFSVKETGYDVGRSACELLLRVLPLLYR